MKSFTITEVLISMGILFLILSSSLLFLGGSNLDIVLKDEVYKIENYLRVARYRSLIKEKDSNWGVYFYNLRERKPFYSIFFGNEWTEANSEGKKILDNYLFFNIPTSGASTTVLFEELTGNLKNATSLEIEVRIKKMPNFGKKIKINQIGTIEVLDLRD